MISALVLFVALQVTPELRRHVDAGLKAKAAGDLDIAIQEFRRVTEIAPGLAAAHVNLGAVLFDKKAYAEAIPSLRRALELNSDLPGVHVMLGTALLAQGFASAAVPHLQRAGAEDLLGVALLESGRIREAVDRLESALLKRPTDPDVLYYLSHAHGQLSRQIVEKLRQVAGTSARAQQITGEILAAAGQRDAAQLRYQEALTARPDLRGVHYALGELYLEAADYEKAEGEFRAEARLVPGSAAVAYKLGSVLFHRGQVKEAVFELERANKLEPNIPETLLELGKALIAAGDPKGALDYLQQLLKHNEGSRLSEAAHFQLAGAYRKLGKQEEAAREMRLFQELRAKRK